MRRIVLMLITALLMLAGCKTTGTIGDDEYLLNKNTIVLNRNDIPRKTLGFDPNDLNDILLQKPNKKFLGLVRPGLWVNSFASKRKQSKFKKWLNKTMGSEPVVFDAYKVDRSVKQLQQYLNNYGYFNSKVNYEVIKKNKKANVKYTVSLSMPYIIRNIFYKIPDSAVRKAILEIKDKLSVKKNSVYNVDLLDQDRQTIAAHLRNLGYYYFLPEFVFYEVDSAFNNHEMVIYLNVEQVQIPDPANPDSTLLVDHKKYYVNNIYINPDFDPLLTDTSNMSVYRNPNPKKGINHFLIYYRNKLKFRPKTLRNSIFLEPMKLYSEKKEKNTFKQLSSYPLFGYTSIEFKPSQQPEGHSGGDKNFLNCEINLTRKPVQSFSIEAEGTTSGGKLGMAGNLVYKNLNIFRGGEVLTLKLSGGLEWQQGGGKRNDVFLFFNTIETGAEAYIDFPKFLLPVSQDKIPKLLKPKTSIRVGINYQNRPDYKRYISNLSFGYYWRAKSFRNHRFIPIEVNSVSIFPDSAFIKKIIELNDPRLTNQYSDHFIMITKYSYIYNNQQRGKIKNFKYLRWNIETGGNLLQLIKNLSNAPKNEDDYYTVMNIPYAQYVRSDIDYRHYFALSSQNTFVARAMLGVGVPYGNSPSLPFEKGFYSGGANGMRGWEYRDLGPGGFRDSSGAYFERMGDITFGANLEYRFPVYSFLKGAVFMDFGNIWLLYSSTTFPGGKFSFNKFLGEIAVDGGLGARLDFDFFIFRVDAAIALKDPSYPAGERWQFNHLQIKQVIWNFGIGYPF
jgi:outer membrane protein assembly factor BamA